MNTFKTLLFKITSGNQFILIIIIAFFYKTIQFILVQPQIVVDSNDYLVSANYLFDFDNETIALRLPVYPLLIRILSLISPSLRLIIIIQLVLGIISVILLYLTVEQISGDKSAFICALLFLLSPTALYDSVIATESLAIFLNIAF